MRFYWEHSTKTAVYALSGTGIVSTSSWTHVVAVREDFGAGPNQQVKWYKNGQLFSTDDNSGVGYTPPDGGGSAITQIGRSANGDATQPGHVGSIRVYDEVLSAAAIQSIYTSEQSYFISSPSYGGQECRLYGAPFSPPVISNTLPTGTVGGLDPISFSVTDLDDDVDQSTLDVDVIRDPSGSPTTYNAIIDGAFQTGWSGTITANAFGGFDVLISTHPFFVSDLYEAQAYVEDDEDLFDSDAWQFTVASDPPVISNGQPTVGVYGDSNISFIVTDVDGDADQTTLDVDVIEDPVGTPVTYQAMIDGVFQPNWGGTITANANGGFNVIISAHPFLNPGLHEVQVYVEDLGGNSDYYSWRFGVATPSPDPSTTGPPDPSYRLSENDREKLLGFSEIRQPEPDQLIPTIPVDLEEVETSSEERLTKVRNKAQEMLAKVDELKQRIDERCGRFNVSSEEIKGSPLFQAMVRVFDERTTTVTYSHYKRALQYRQQLALEDAEKVKEQ
jgi:hypothetical protein